MRKVFNHKSDIERGELVESLHAIARKCGCCAATVRNVFDSLKTLGLLAFEAIKNVAMKVKLMFYPALKEAAKKVTKAIQTFVKKTQRMIMSQIQKGGSTFCV